MIRFAHEAQVRHGLSDVVALYTFTPAMMCQFGSMCDDVLQRVLEVVLKSGRKRTRGRGLCGEGCSSTFTKHARDNVWTKGRAQERMTCKAS